MKNLTYQKLLLATVFVILLAVGTWMLYGYITSWAGQAVMTGRRPGNRSTQGYSGRVFSTTAYNRYSEIKKDSERERPTVDKIDLTPKKISLTEANRAEKSRTTDSVKNFLSKCETYKPITYKNLTIVPVKAPSSSKHLKMLVLDEALSDKSIQITEVSRSGRVNTLQVTNNSDKPVFIMAGEILLGAKQDRVLESDIIIPGKAKKIKVKAYCVEQNRWNYNSNKFHSSGKNANVSVRKAAKVSKSQGKVWNNVSRSNVGVGAPASGSLSKSYESKKFKEKKDDFSTKFLYIPEDYPGVNGIVVFVNDRALVADIFSNREIFRKIWPKLMDSYILEASGRETSRDKKRNEFKSTDNLLNSAISARTSFSKSQGIGKQVKISSNKIKGTGIIYNKIPVHLDIFPENAKSENIKK
ncbi:MAG: hypothetical protein K8T10_02900 [Candidatus Eremiobacteraeota bacterium]|nr:hypothetical protein [Candidatus Eremiobacteraeota bacterium]